MAAIVLKSHHESTVGRAALVREATGFPTYGGLALNSFVSGGLDVDAAEVALALGARIIWLPTLSSPAHVRLFGRADQGWTDPARSPAALPIGARTVSMSSKAARAALKHLCGLVATSDAVLASGHADARTIAAVAGFATSAGARFVITHPEYEVPGLTVSHQASLAIEHRAIVFERCAYVSSPRAQHQVPPARVAAGIRATGGAARNVLASDLGQPANPAYPDGLLAFATALTHERITRAQARSMLTVTPRRVLGISAGT